MLPYREVFRNTYADTKQGTAWLSDGSIAQKANTLPLPLRLRVDRVLLLIRVVAKAPPLLLHLLRLTSSLPHSWAWVLFHDLAWLATYPKFRDCSSCSVPAWIDALQAQPRAFRKAVRTFAQLGAS